MKKTIAAVLASVMVTVLLGCGSSGSTAAGNTAQNNSSAGADSSVQSESEESGQQYQWDINGDMEMHWETGDDYKQYVQIADTACPLGTIEDTPFVSMKAIFPSWEGWPQDEFSKTDIMPWHFDTEAELGEEADADGEGLIVWGSLVYPKNTVTGESFTAESDLSYYLHGERAREANEGTLVTTTLRTREINGQTVKYVRMQYEWDHYLSSGETITMCVQRTLAIISVETPDGITVFLEVMIDEFRTDPATLSDDSIIDLIFENVIIE